jgi:hypothetical protein
MRKINRDTLDKYISQLSDNGRSFIVCRKRNTSSIMMRGKNILLQKGSTAIKKEDNKNKSKVTSLISQVAKNINNYIIKNNLEVKPVKQVYSSTLINRDKWKSIKVGGTFNYIDIAHCFWRIAYQQFYISERLYFKTLETPELKIYRNMALACIVAPNIREYYIRGIKVNEIKEDKSLHSIIYNNIRFISYNLMGDLSEAVGKSFISYRTDGIMVDKKATKIVKQLLEEQCFDYRVEECVKINELEYKHKGVIKKI